MKKIFLLITFLMAFVAVSFAQNSKGVPSSDTQANIGEVFAWDGTSWNPVPTLSIAPVQSIVPGTGVSVATDANGNVTITNDAPANATDEGRLDVGVGGANTATITSNTTGSPSVTIEGGANVTVTEDVPTKTITIEAAAANVQSIIAGSDISVSDDGNGNITITNDAPANQTDEIQNLALAGNDLSISNGNTVTLPTADGSETIISALAPIKITGAGTSADPYVASLDVASMTVISGSTGAQAEANAVTAGLIADTPYVHLPCTGCGKHLMVKE